MIDHEEQDKSSATLIPLIQGYIYEVLFIIWSAYRTLQDLGYSHFVINHSENFADPDNVDHWEFVEGLELLG